MFFRNWRSWIRNGGSTGTNPNPTLLYSCYFSLPDSFPSVVPMLCLSHRGKIRSQISFAGSTFLLKVRLFLLSWGNWEHIGSTPHFGVMIHSKQGRTPNHSSWHFSLRSWEIVKKNQSKAWIPCSYSFSISKGSCTGMEIICVWFLPAHPTVQTGSSQSKALSVCK